MSWGENTMVSALGALPNDEWQWILAKNTLRVQDHLKLIFPEKSKIAGNPILVGTVQ